MSKDPSRLPPLDLLVAFEAVARHGSITRGAAERFITQSAMSRQIAALEADLGLPLFQRRHRALVLTDAGRRLLAACTPVLAQLREAMVALRAPNARTVLSLTTTPSFASLWLIPRLAGFTRAHPGVDVRLDASFERRDLVREGFDLAVRYGPQASAAGAAGAGGMADGQRLFGEAIVPVCSPALRRQPGAPLVTPADLAHHTLLQLASVQPGGMPLEWESWLQALGWPQVQPRSTLTFNSYNETIAAAVAGQGIALGRRPLIDALLRKRQLVVPFGDATDTARAYWLVVSPTARDRPAVQALAQWLQAQAGGGA
jgi:DNA-binding transcriptional LysR family regulator